MATAQVPVSTGEQRQPRLTALTTATDQATRLPALLTDPYSGRSVALCWLITRSLTLTLLVWIENIVSGDVAYYGRSLQSMFAGGGVRETLQEYPLPVLGILVPQFNLGLSNPTAFALIFVGSMLAIDAAVTRMFWVANERERSGAVTFWLWFLPALGPMAYFRFDILPAALAAGIVLWSIRRPAVAGVFTAVGAALKLWPAILLPILLARRGGRRALLVAALTTGAVIGAVCLWVGGVGRLRSPLSWQEARGLQVESVPAVPLMLLRGVHPHGIWHVQQSRYKSAEIFGPGVPFFLMLTTLATVGTVVFLGVVIWRARALADVPVQTMAWLLLSAAMLITVTNKTLSPQYLLWLAGPLGALLIFRHNSHQAGGTALRSARWLMVAALLTQWVYPIKYGTLMNVRTQTAWVTSGLAARNIILVLITFLVCREAWRQTRPHDVSTESDPELSAQAKA